MVLLDTQDKEFMQTVAKICGYVSTVCFVVQYLPQTYLNWKRKSVQGFSTTGILIKLIGAAYFFVNSALLDETLSTTLYGLFNVTQHIVFMIQFTVFTGDRSFLVWCLFPAIPLLMGAYFPQTIEYTSLIKPLSQFFSHIPQLVVSVQHKSTEGVSLLSQHLNFIGGILGLYLYYIIAPKSKITYLVYFNSLFQAVSVYVLCILYDGWTPFIKSFHPNTFFHVPKLEVKVEKVDKDAAEQA